MPDLPPLVVTSWYGKITAGSALTGVVLLLISIVKQWGPWRKQASDERREDFQRLRDDAREAREDARRCAEAVQRLENMTACMRPAISILIAEVRRLDPEAGTNAAIIQAQELMAMATTGDFGLAAGLRSLVTTKGVGE